MFKRYASIKKQLHNKTYDQNRKNFDKIVSLWVYYVTRPISFIVTPVFIMCGFSADISTFFGFVLGVLSFIFSINGELFYAALFYNLFLIFDSVDGNIARLNGATVNGEYYDAITGDLINFLFIPFIGFGIYHNDCVYFFLDNITHYNLFTLSLIVSLMQLLLTLNSQRKKIIFDKKNNGPVRIGNRERISIIEYIIRNSFGFAFNAPFSLILAYYHAIDILIIYNILILPFILLFSIFKK